MRNIKNLFQRIRFHHIVLSAVLLFILAIYINKTRPPYFIGVPPREAQTASQARYYYNYGIDLLHPKYDLTPAPQYLAFEFPLYQALVAILYRMLGFREIWGKLLSVFELLILLIYLYLFVAKFLNSKLVAALSPLVFSVFPYSLRFIPTFLVDPLVLLLSIMVLYHGLAWADHNRSRDLIVMIIAGLLACLIKFVVFVPVCLPLLLIVLSEFKQDMRNTYYKREIYFASTIVSWLTAIIVWAFWAGDLNSKTTLQGFGEEGSTVSLLVKFLGTIEMRFSPFYYDSIKWIFEEFMPSWLPRWAWVILFLMGLLICLLHNQRRFALILWSYVIGFITMFIVFFPAVSTHIYYWLPAVPVMTISLLCLIDFFHSQLDRLLISIKVNSTYQHYSYSLIMFMALMGAVWTIRQLYLTGLFIFRPNTPNIYDYYVGIAILVFLVGMSFLLVYRFHINQLSAGVVFIIILMSFISLQFYRTSFLPNERWWTIEKGYHWVTTPLLISEASFINGNMSPNRPVTIVTAYQYYPHLLYMSGAHGYTVTFPNEDLSANCLSPSKFPKSLGAPCISLMYEQGIRDVFVVFYHEGIDMDVDEFKSFVPNLNLEYVNELKMADGQYGEVLHYHIRTP